jgi:hypothetical protein
MKAKVVENAGALTYVALCDPGDEVASALNQFARSARLEVVQRPDIGIPLIDLDRSQP